MRARFVWTGVVVVCLVVVFVAILHCTQRQPPAGTTPPELTVAAKPGRLPVPAATNRNPKAAIPPSPRRPFPPIARPQLDAIPATLSVVMGQGEKENYFTRIKAIHGLKRNLSPDEVTALYALLYRKAGEDKLPLEQLNALKNDAVTVLRAQESKPADLARHLVSMFDDPSFDPVWRDYCVQHLGSWFRNVDVEEQRQAVCALFWDATSEKDTSIAGTALIALCNNIDRPEIEKGRIATKALALSEDPKCGELAKITALQVCAKLGESQVLPTARQVAESTASVPLRMSAIAAVGTLGVESDRTMLEKYAASSDGRLRTAAQAALKRLGKGHSAESVSVSPSLHGNPPRDFAQQPTTKALELKP